MYQSTGKPSVAKFRARLQVMNDAARSGRQLAEKWNPKGRYFKIQRDMIEFFSQTERETNTYLAFINSGKRQKNEAGFIDKDLDFFR